MSTAGPVFVFGPPRSGTTAVATALATHTDFWTSGESYVLWDLYGEGQLRRCYDRAPRMSESGWLRAQGVSWEEFAAAAGAGMDALFSSRSNGRRWVDHTPHYLLMADDLATMFPDASFVVLVRSGINVVSSMGGFLSTVRDPEVARMIERREQSPWAVDFSVACRTWTDYTAAGMRFTERLSDRCLVVRQEALVADLESTCAAMLEFLGAPWQRDPEDFLRTNAVNSSNGGVPRDEAASWDSWAPWQQEQFCAIAGPTSERAGYGIPNVIAS